jgi:hypothetical protein
MHLDAGICSLFTGIAVVAALSVYEPRLQSHTVAVEPCSCGRNLAEARANGCKYDSVAAAWLPPACRDDENDMARSVIWPAR